jgi:hypothetical protein
MAFSSNTRPLANPAGLAAISRKVHFVPSKGGVVELPRNHDLLRIELLQLMEKQVDTLKKETFGSLTEEERRGYGDRQTRIHDLLSELYSLVPVA